MKILAKKISLWASGPLMLILLFSFQCSNDAIPKDYMGNWQSSPSKVTVRTKIKWMKYEFKSDIIPLSLAINANNTASGKIGMASFENAVITKNSGNPSVTGIAYIIHCGKLNKLFAADNSGEKMIEIWLKPKQDQKGLEAEIRLKDGWDTFPMGDCTFSMNP